MKIQQVITGVDSLDPGQSGPIQSNKGYDMFVELPPKGMYGAKAAMVMLNVTAPYAKGDDYPGIEFSLVTRKPEATLITGCITSESKDPDSFGRRPITLVKAVELTNDELCVYAYWKSIRNSTCIIDWMGPATLTAILADGFF